MIEDILRIVQQNGIYVFLTGLITCILIGLIKTPIHKKFIECNPKLNLGETEEEIAAKKKKAENIFDTVVFLSTYIFALVGAMIYYAITRKAFDILPILGLSASVWLSQSLCYGIWKKLGLKRALSAILRLIIKDRNKDGKISLDEAIAQVKDAYKNGKLDINKLIEDAAENAEENFIPLLDEVTEGVEVSPEVEKVAGIMSNLTEAQEISKEEADEQVFELEAKPEVQVIEPVQTIVKRKVIEF